MYLVSVISIYLTPVTLSASLVSAPPLSSLPVTKVTSTTITWEANTKHNPASSIVEGIISPERFTKMTSQVSPLSKEMLSLIDHIEQEVASEERKVGDNKIEEENLFEPLAAAEQQAEISTDAFQCLRCKQVRLNKKKLSLDIA